MISVPVSFRVVTTRLDPRRKAPTATVCVTPEPAVMSRVPVPTSTCTSLKTTVVPAFMAISSPPVAVFRLPATVTLRSAESSIEGF